MSQEERDKETKSSVGSKVALGSIILAVIGLITAFFNQGGLGLIKEIWRPMSQQPSSTPTSAPTSSSTQTPTPTVSPSPSQSPSPSPSPSPTEIQPVPTSSLQKKIEDNDFRFEFQRCQRNGSKVICNLSITNLANIDRDIQLSAWYGRENFSRIVDASGNEYQATMSQLGQAQQYAGSPVKVRLIQDIPMKGSLVFDNVPQEVDKLAVIEVAYVFYNPYNVYRTAQFRDVNIEPVTR